MASRVGDVRAGASGSAEDRKLALLILRIQLVIAALMTFAIGCFAIPAQVAAHRYDSASHCAGATQGPDCVASVPVTVASIGKATDGKKVSYWLELTGLGAGQTQFTPVTPGAGISGLIGQVTPRQELTAILWHGDLVQVESDAAVAVSSGSPGIGARNWLGGFAIPFSCFLGLLIMYLGKRFAGRRGTVIAMVTGALVIVNGLAFLILQYELTTKPTPLLALPSFAAVGLIAAVMWVLYTRVERHERQELAAALEPQDARPDSSS